LRNIGSRWRNLADGLLRIETLEAQLLTEWGQRLDKAHKERQEAARQRAWRRATLISALVVALLMLALSIVLLRLASPAATIVLRLAFLLPTVLAICGVSFLLRSPDPIHVRMTLPYE
jgi:lipopolysaccharide export LptBFGC system permease protein LptF